MDSFGPIGTNAPVMDREHTCERYRKAKGLMAPVAAATAARCSILASSSYGQRCVHWRDTFTLNGAPLGRVVRKGGISRRLCSVLARGTRLWPGVLLADTALLA